MPEPYTVTLSSFEKKILVDAFIQYLRTMVQQGASADVLKKWNARIDELEAMK